jgi:lysozyme
MQYKTSQAGIDLIKSFEALKLRAYPDPASGSGPWTIGYGTTSNVVPGMTITRAQAESLLRRDLAKIEKEINRLVTVEISQNMFDALVSFAYNLGIGSLKRSTLLKKLNLGDAGGAADQLLRWNRARGRTMAGLTRRRKAERDLFLA